jgi:hypothetical protein
MFGVPGTGIHKYRFLDTAIVDYLGSIIIAMLITKFTKVPLVITTILVLLLGILSHYLFCLKTGTEMWLG